MPWVLPCSPATAADELTFSFPRLANVAGTQEPIYGPSAIRSVAAEVDDSTHSETTRDDFKWQVMDSTNVETQSFYFVSDSGRIGMAQVIYSNVAYATSAARTPPNPRLITSLSNTAVSV